MSDPVTRRSKAVGELLQAIKTSERGFLKMEAIRYLCALYGFGLSQRGADRILRDLTELGILYIKGMRYHVKKE